MEDLLAEAKKVIDQNSSDNHKVAAVMRASDGRIFTSVSVQGQKLHLCSEWSAFTQALMAKANVTMAVALRKRGDEYIVYPPCGICRELYMTYYPDATVIVSEDKSVKASKLLPDAWSKS